jgi:hypothetical protein
MDHTSASTVRRVSRWAGAVGLVFLVLVFLGNNPPFYGDASNGRMLRWVEGHPTALYVEGARTAYMMIVMVAFLAALMWLTGVTGVLRSAVWALLGASMAIDMVWSGVYDALAYAAEHHIGDSGVLAMATLTEQLTFTDGVLWGVAVLVISVVALRGRSLPAPLAWLGVVTAVVKVVGPAAQVALTGTSEGVTGPVGTVLLVFWLLAVSLTLLVRPERTRAVVDLVETPRQESGDTVQ